MRVRMVCVGMVVALLGACGGQDDQDAGAGGNGSAPDPGSEQGRTERPESAANLNEDVVKRWIAACQDLRERGTALGADLGDDPSRLRALGASLSWTGEMKEILKRHGFDQMSFTGASAAIGRAMAAVAVEDVPEPAMPEMQGLSPEAKAQMKEAMDTAKAQSRAIVEGVPEAHRDLVRRLRAEIEAAFNN